MEVYRKNMKPLEPRKEMENSWTGKIIRRWNSPNVYGSISIKADSIYNLFFFGFKTVLVTKLTKQKNLYYFTNYNCRIIFWVSFFLNMLILYIHLPVMKLIILDRIYRSCLKHCDVEILSRRYIEKLPTILNSKVS